MTQCVNPVHLEHSRTRLTWSSSVKTAPHAPLPQQKHRPAPDRQIQSVGVSQTVWVNDPVRQIQTYIVGVNDLDRQADRWTVRWMDEQTDRWTYGWMDRQTDG